jgi:hypothetical protein
VEVIAESPGMRKTVATVERDLRDFDGVSVLSSGGPDAGTAATQNASGPAQDASAPADVVVAVKSKQAADGTVRSLVAFDGATGLRLCDIELPGVIGQVLNEASADGVRRAIDRRANFGAANQLVGVLAVRNVDLPAAHGDLPSELGMLFERELFSASGIGVLERQRLDVLNQQRSGQSKATAQCLLGASVLIELDIAQDPSAVADHLQITATLTDPSGKLLGTVNAKGTSDDVPGLAHALASAVEAALAQLPASVPAVVRGNVEANRFAAESKAAIAHDDWRTAAIDAEAAAALAPSSPRCQILLTKMLITEGVRSINPRMDSGFLLIDLRPPDLDWDSTLQTLHRGSQHLLALRRGPAELRELADSVAMLDRFCISMIEAQPVPGRISASTLTRPDDDGEFDTPKVKLTDAQRKLLSSIIWDERKYRLDVELPQKLAAVQDTASFELYSAALLESIAQDCHIFCRTRAEYSESATKRLIEWAPLAGRYATEHLDSYGLSALDLDSAPAIWVGNYHQWANAWRPPCFGKPTPADAKQWKKVADALEAAHAPERLYINLRNWAHGVENPPADDAEKEPAVAHAPSPPPGAPPDAPPEPANGPSRPANAPAQPLAMVYSKSVAIIDSSAGQNDPHCINKPIVVGDQFFVAAIGDTADGGSEIRLMESPTDASKPAQVLSRLSGLPDEFVKSCRMDGNGFFQMPRFLGSEHYILSSDTGLIIVLSRDKTAQRIVDAGKELPGKRLLAAADLGNTVYMVVSDSNAATCLVSYDLLTGHVETLASSRRGAANSPFDNMAGMSVCHMVADPQRDRIVFFAYHSTWADSAKGLWEFSRKTGQFRRLLGTEYARKEGAGGYEVAGSPVVEQKFVLMTGQTLVYDLNADAATDDTPSALVAFEKQLDEPEVYKSWWHRFGNPGGAGVGHGDNTLEHRVGDVHALSDLWQGCYAQFSIDVPPGQLLVADWAGVWLLTPQ